MRVIRARAWCPAVATTEGPGRAGDAQSRPGLTLVTAGLLAAALGAIGIAARSSGAPGHVLAAASSCRPAVYGTGEHSMGGPERHRVTNEGSQPVQVAVRWTVATGTGPGELTVPEAEPEACGNARAVGDSTQP